MKALLWIVSLIVAVGAGAYIGAKRTQPRTDLATSDEWQSKYEELQKKFSHLSDTDLAEYAKLKNQKERYEKADEILAKIMQLMLIDLGVRSAQKNIAANQINKAEADSKKNETTRRDTAPPPTSATSVAANPVIDPNRIRQASTQADVTEILKASELPDFFTSLRGGVSLNQAQIDMLNGRFTGTATFDDPSKKPWQVEIMFFGRIGRNSLRGRHDIKIIADGRQVSHTRGSINDDTYVSLNTESVSVIIDAYRGNGYFHLYYFPRLNAFYGNVYTKEGGVGNFKRTGIVHLNKI